MSNITLALPKGRLTKSIHSLLQKCGYTLQINERQLVVQADNLRILLVKNSDLPVYVHHGIAELGICGSDVLYESGYELLELLSLPFGGTRICLAGMPQTDIKQHSILQVATKLPRFTRAHFHARGIPVSVIQLNGSVELAPILGLAPYIVDLVETGKTLQANGLEIKETLTHTEAFIIANPALYKYRYQEIQEFIRHIEQQITHEKNTKLS